MQFSASRRKVAGVVATLLTALTVVVAPFAPQANAQQANAVLFGDSVLADPTVPGWAAGKMGLDPRGSSNVATWCPTSPTSFGKQAAAKLGLPAWDYSCTGTISISQGPKVGTQVDRALNDGALTPSTRRVILTTGFNDAYNTGNRTPDQARAAYVSALTPQIDRIRQAAPNARIQIVGYPQITDGFGNVCLFHVGPNMFDRTPAPQVAGWENLAQWMQVDLANATGVEFLDMKPSTRWNSMCAQDDKRMWAGLVDFYGGPGNLPIHVNQRGHAHVSEVIARS
ncbi:GDSL-type esterase/lipase family protein [Corynebacterium breve]|uniref:GDSL-type esterase/lipase family protein n=1 Tax=Corynebacterium breve TaxID=3049799 RepID=A0ABY8VF42_9CORY|nr:GDSL-type esterase/lipase family protein [Corynebacterium breve]WIM67962.1 GDSL-type esterase/lipase family protein [Corynebacterium breve]